MNTLTIRSATPADLPEIESIERACFSAIRRSSHRSLQRSLRSPVQQVFVAVETETARMAAAIVLHCRPKMIRIYSVAVLPAFRRAGVGRQLVDGVIADARAAGKSYVGLEADRRDGRLVRWYESFGFKVSGVLKDYYSPGRDAVRMRLEWTSK